MCGEIEADVVEAFCQRPEDIVWPVPGPLEGAKSLKRLVFEVECAHVGTGCATTKVCSLAISLSSRIFAVGDACHAADLLLDTTGVLTKRHEDLKVLHLAPSHFSCTWSSSDYVKAISSTLADQSPHIVVLSEVESSENAAWKEVFDGIVCGEGLWKFHGAVVICALSDTATLRACCSEHWVTEVDRVIQRPCFQVIDNALVTGLEELLADAAQIAYCDLRHWIQRAQSQGSKVTRFDAGGCKGPGRLCGLIFHHMIESSAEFHVRFIFVPKQHRKSGIGSMLMRWVIEAASRMALSDCRWISLECSDDELLPWYEKFGFMDMSCGHVDGDGGQTRMELQNVPKAPK